MSRESSATNRLKAFLFLFVIASIVINEAYGKPPRRLIGGSDSPLGEIVYQASLRLYGKHRCGGTLVSTRHVITAAHCVSDLTAPYKELTVVTGTNSLATGGVTHKIDDIDIHADFKGLDDGTWHNDIAVITLAGHIEVNTYQSPIALPEEETVAHVVALISGWGYKDYDEFPDGEFSTILQKSDMTILSNEECQEAHRETIDHEQICGIKDTFSGICKGDGGSPMVTNGSVIAIASWYYPCALGLPDVYTRVYHYLGWILEIISRSFYDDFKFDFEPEVDFSDESHERAIHFHAAE